MEQVSSNPKIQEEYEMFSRGYDAGYEDAKMQIINLIELSFTYKDFSLKEYLLKMIKETTSE